mgnify:CR=1 FL=1
MYKHNFTITELEDMIPWEREIYINLLENYIEEKNKKNSGKNKQIEEHKEQKVPMTYDTVKNAATGSGNDTVRLKK